MYLCIQYICTVEKYISIKKCISNWRIISYNVAFIITALRLDTFTCTGLDTRIRTSTNGGDYLIYSCIRLSLYARESYCR